MTTYSPELAIPEVAQAQNNKYLTINDQAKFSGQAANRALGSATTGDWTLTEAQFTRYFTFKPSGRSADFNVIIPDAVNVTNAERFFAVWNADTTYTATVKAVSAGTTVLVPPGNIVLMYRNGVNVTAFTIPGLPSGTSLAYDVGFFVPGQPASGAFVLIYDAVRPYVLPGDFAGSKCRVGTNPTSTAVFTVQKNESNVGTISINTSGVATFSSTSSLPVSFAAGDHLEIIAPSPQDATLADVNVSFKGTRTG